MDNGLGTSIYLLFSSACDMMPARNRMSILGLAILSLVWLAAQSFPWIRL